MMCKKFRNVHFLHIFFLRDILLTFRLINLNTSIHRAGTSYKGSLSQHFDIVFKKVTKVTHFLS